MSKLHDIFTNPHVLKAIAALIAAIIAAGTGVEIFTDPHVISSALSATF